MVDWEGFWLQVSTAWWAQMTGDKSLAPEAWQCWAIKQTQYFPLLPPVKQYYEVKWNKNWCTLGHFQRNLFIHPNKRTSQKYLPRVMQDKRNTLQNLLRGSSLQRSLGFSVQGCPSSICPSNSSLITPSGCWLPHGWAGTSNAIITVIAFGYGWSHLKKEW